MIEKLLPLKFPPGLANTGTTYQSKGRWHAGNFVRFFNGAIQPIGGWASVGLTGASISGIPRTAHAWLTTNGTSVIALGTSTHLYAIVAGVVYDITGTATVGVSPTWTLDNFGDYLVANACEESAGLIGLAAGAGYWDGNTSHALQRFNITSGHIAPDNAQATFVTPEHFVVLLGGVDPQGVVTPSSVADIRMVFWADQDSLTDWDFSSSTNQAGAFPLQTNGALICGAAGRGQSLIWSTTDLFTMTYIGAPLVYSFAKVGSNCGAISSRAAIVQNGEALWMGPNGFFKYDGFVKPIDCDMQDFLFTNINRSLAANIWALHNVAYNEITWFYPSLNASDVDSYITYNYVEDHWVSGSLVRTAGIASIPPGMVAGVQVPGMFNASGTFFEHETGLSFNSEGTPSLESGPIELGDGDQLMAIQHIVPDDKTVGDVNLTIYTTNYPDTAEVSNGPYTLSSLTSVRLKARQVRIKLTQAAAHAWRVGVIRLSAIPSSSR